ncbi:MAG: aldo/keto reductase [Thaumarchaeota archaeon]|nr:aldo/keto reductase [Nitrososphaerota archaeon]
MQKKLSHSLVTNDKYEIEIPIIGLGVWGMSKNKTENAVKSAINTWYKHIDTAQIYKNEEQVGKAVKERKDIFITTKLWESNFGYEKTIEACERSLSKLNRIDLFLVHSPHKPKLRKETWEAMQYLLKNKYVKAIGVSNFGIHHIKEILSWAEIGPCINQIELSPFLQRTELVNFCKANGISTTAYSPLTHGIKINDKKLKKISERYKRTSAQILIRWSIQKGNIAIPKSSNKNRIEENFDVFNFKIKNKDMELLDEFEQEFITSWNPTIEP